MARTHKVTIDGHSFPAQHGQLLLDAALSNGIDLPYDCRAGHCGTCCVRLVAGEVRGGQGSEPGVVHACQCRIIASADIETDRLPGVQSMDGVVSSLLPLSHEVVQVCIRTSAVLPHLPGQYAQVQFEGYPTRPFSMSLPLRSLRGNPNGRSLWFHVRRMKGGRVTAALGKRIRPGHRVTLTGPFGSAHFRPNLQGPLILLATSTGFAPIWSIAVAALRERPDRMMMVIAGGRTLQSLYMWPALVRLAKFRNVLVVPACSTPQWENAAVQHGRPTDFLPHLMASDVIHACGAPALVDAVKAIAARAGATCHADPFLPTTSETDEGVLIRAKEWLGGLAKRQAAQLAPDRPRTKRDQPMQAYRG